MRAKVFFAGLVLSTAMAASAGAAPLDEFVRVCADPGAAPSDVVHFCGKALDSGKLPTRATAQVRVNLGVALFELGRYPAAIGEYTLAIDTLPELVPAYINRARAYEKSGLIRQAVEDYI